ncbi:unnamed protein product, partial [Protopolystoma xenopodis]
YSPVRQTPRFFYFLKPPWTGSKTYWFFLLSGASMSEASSSVTPSSDSSSQHMNKNSSSDSVRFFARKFASSKIVRSGSCTDHQLHIETSTLDDNYASDDASIQAGGSLSDGAAKNYKEKHKIPSRRAFVRPFTNVLSGTSFGKPVGHRKTVYLETGGKYIHRAFHPKDKPQDISREITRCRTVGDEMLDLSNMALDSIPGNILKEVSWIRRLFLYDNKLTSLPSSLGQLSHLQCLMLQQNWLTASGLPNEITKLKHLDQLDLRHNRLEGPLPTCIYALTSLQKLLLTYNKITYLDEDIENFKDTRN